jgi:hypothetical protein
MLSVQFLPHAFLLILFAQGSPQIQRTPKVERIQMKQEDLCCFDMKFVKPKYPREARLAHTEGVVKLKIVVADDNSIADIQPVSGDLILLDSSIKAVHQWRIYSSLARVKGKPVEMEIPVSFTFSIDNPPKPAYLHLINGKVIRADTVQEFTDRIEYNVGSHIHRIPSDSVNEVNACAQIVLRPVLKEGECNPSGGPSFDIHAIPLLPSNK